MEICSFALFEPPLGAYGQPTIIILDALDARRGLPISVSWTFFARCNGWGATIDYRFKIDTFAPTGAAWLKNFR